MDMIPYIRLVFSVVAFGFMYYVYNNVYEMVTGINYFGEQAAGTTYQIMLVIWMALPIIYLMYASVKFIMSVQSKEGYR